MRVIYRSAVTLTFALTACGGGGDKMTGTTPTSPGGTATCTSTSMAVSVGDNFFSPDCTKLPVGTTVTWTWTGSNAHDVTWANTTLGASQLQSSGTYTKKFTTAGSYDYHCTRHAGMTGTIVIQ